MVSTGIQPDTRVYTSGILSCRLSGNWQQARTFSEEMKSRDIIMDDTAHAALISTCFEYRDWEQALQFLNYVPSKSERSTRAYAMALSVCLGASQWAQVLRLLDEMRATGCPTFRCLHLSHILDI